MVYTFPFQPSDYSVICIRLRCSSLWTPRTSTYVPLNVSLSLFNQFIMLSVGLYSIRSGPSTLILTRLDKASYFMLVLAVVLILLTELKPLSHSAVVGEIVSIMRIRIIICFMCCTSAEFISPTRVSYASITARCKLFII